MPQQRMWSRIGHWLRSSNRPREEAEGTQTTRVVDPQADGLAELDLGLDSASCLEEAIVPSTALRKPDKEPLLERLEDGYARVTNLVESIQAHMETQDQHRAETAQALTSLAASLQQLPGAAQAQTEALQRVEAQLEGQAVRGRKLEENLTQWPRLADAQRETLAAVGHELELNREAGSETRATLEGLGEAVQALGSATELTTATMSRLQTEAAEREQQLAQVLQERTSRLTWFVAGVTALAAVAIVIAVAALLA